MKTSSWFKKGYLWDTLCASWDMGMAWLLRIKMARRRLAKQLRRRHFSGPFLPSFDALETRTMPSISSLTWNAPGTPLVEGALFGSPGQITFSESQSGAQLKDITAMILWGDGNAEMISGSGSASGLSLSYNTSTKTGTFSFNYDYVEQGTKTLTAVIFDDLGTWPGTNAADDIATIAGGNTSGVPAANMTTGTVAMSDATLSAVASTAQPGLTAVEGEAWSGPVFRFTDSNSYATPADYTTASIAWGDGTTTTLNAATNPVAVVWDPSHGGGYDANSDGFDMRGSHTYTEDGTFTATVIASDAGGQSITSTRTFVVNDAPLVPGNLTPPDVPVNSSQSFFFDGVVFHFADNNADAPTTGTLDYPAASATILWGDGHTTTADSIVSNANGGYDVFGSHTYTASFSGNFSVTVVDKGGSTLSAASAISSSNPTAVADNPPVIAGSSYNQNNVVNEPLVPIGEVTLGVNYGDLRLSQPLDFDLSPGTGVGRNPALDYNSNTAAPDPIVKVPFATDPSQSALPTSIVADLVWNGTVQSAVTFTSFGSATKGNTVVLALPVTSAITATGLYDWSVTATAHYSSTSATETYSGNTPVVLNHGPLGSGWGIDGIDQLITVSDGTTSGAILLHGNGDFEFFTESGSTFSSPPGDFGTLQTSGSGYTYTNPYQTTETFNSSGYLISVSDRDGLSTTYSYSGNQLTGVVAADGGSTTLSYTSGALSKIVEPGPRTLTISESGGELTQLTDAAGFTRAFSYTTGSLYSTAYLLTTDQWAPFTATFTYGSEDNVTGVNLGLSSTYALAAAAVEGLAPNAVPYNTQGNATITDPLTHAAVYTLDWNGRNIGMTKPDGAMQTWDLNSNGETTLYTDALANATSYSYDSAGDLLTENFADGGFTDFAYDSTFHQVTAVTQSEASGVTESTNNTISTVNGDTTHSVSTTAPSGSIATSYGWGTGAMAGLMTSMVDGRGLTTTYGYDSHRRLTSITEPLTAIVTYYGYDSNGNPTTVTDPNNHTSTTQYDADNRLTETIDQASAVTSLQYDAAGFLTQTIDPRTVTTRYTYDQRGWQTTTVRDYGAADAITTIKAYDTAGDLTSLIDGRTQTTTFAYDNDKRMTLATDPDGDTTQAFYDLNDHVTEIIDVNNNTTNFFFDHLGRKTEVVDALFNTAIRSYDLAGNLTATVDERGFTTTYSYDEANRLTKTVVPVSVSGGTTTNITTTKAYDNNGNVTATVDGNGETTTYSFDNDNRLTLTAETVVFSGVTSTLTFQNAYDNAGNVTKTIDALSHVTSYAYDSANRLTQAIDPALITTSKAYDADGNVTKTVDGRTLTTQYSYDDFNRLTKVVDPVPITTYQYYDNDNNVTETIDGIGTTIQYAFDSANRLTLTTELSGTLSITTQGSYDKNGNLTQEIDPDGVTIATVYDADKRVIKGTQTVVSSGVTQTLVYSKAYDASGNVIQRTDPLGEVFNSFYDMDNRPTAVAETVNTLVGPQTISTQANYDAHSNVTLAVDALGKTTSYVFDAANRLEQTTDVFSGVTYSTSNSYDLDGNVTLAVDPRNKTTTYGYDADNRLTKTTDPDTFVTQVQYDNDGNVTASVDARTHTTTYLFDNDNRLTETIDPDNFTNYLYYDGDANVTKSQDARTLTTLYSYDYLNRLTQTIDPLNHTQKQLYDHDGNVTQLVDFAGLTTQFFFDALDRLTKTIDPLSHTTQKAYDLAGNVTKTINAANQTTKYFYDQDSRLTETMDANGNVTLQAYDAGGDLTLLTDADNNKTTCAYDNAGRMTLMTDPVGHTATYGYDNNGNLTKAIDRDGRTDSFVYDNDNRLVTETWFAAGGTVALDTLLYTYDGDGNVLTAGNNQGTYTLSYDNDERVTQVIGLFGTTLTMGYDQNGNRTSVIDSFGGTETSTYTNDNMLKTRTFLNGASQIAEVTLAYNNDNWITQEMAYSTATPGAVVMTATYRLDNDHNVTSITAINAGNTTMATYSMSYDANNNLISEIDHGYTMSYNYDSAEQLTLGSETGSLTQSYAYSYDAAGNRSMAGYGTTTGNEMTSDGVYSYSYDAEANEITKTKTGDTWTFSYDNADHLTLAVETKGSIVTSTAFKYDAFGNMVEEDVVQGATSTTTRYAYDDWNPAKEGQAGTAGNAVWAVLNATNSLTTRYMQGDNPDQPLVQMTYNGSAYTPYYYVTDQQGSVRDVVDSSGAVKDTVRYDPYGNIVSETGSSFRGLFAWDGYRSDATGFYVVGARVYDPGTGRWLEQDPAGLGGGDANLYRYAGNNPTSRTDPSGLTAVDIAPGGEPARVTSQSSGEFIGFLYQGNVWRQVGSDGRSDWRFVPLSDVQSSWSPLTWTAWFKMYDTYGSVIQVPPWDRQPPPPPPPPPPPQLSTTPAGDMVEQPSGNVTQADSSDPTNNEPHVGSVDKYGCPILPTNVTMGKMQPIGSDAFATFSNIACAPADFASGGLIPLLRQSMGYDTLDYNSPWYQISYGVSAVVVTILTAGANPCAVGGMAGLGLRGLNAVQGFADLGNAWSALSNGDFVGAAINLFSAAAHAVGLSGPCFTGDMQVLTRRGWVRWDQLTQVDEVASADENNPVSKIEFKRIRALVQTVAPIWHVQVKGQVIRTTAEHPFYVWGKAWTAAKDLAEGDRLRSDDGRMVTVQEVFATKREEPVYNCVVEDYHTYFVGSEDWGFSVWAHNGCSSTSGNNAAAVVGKAVHNAYFAAIQALGTGYLTSYRLVSGKIVDAVNISQKVVRELKPNNPSAIAKGLRQAEQYAAELETMFPSLGAFKVIVDVY